MDNGKQFSERVLCVAQHLLAVEEIRNAINLADSKIIYSGPSEAAHGAWKGRRDIIKELEKKHPRLVDYFDRWEICHIDCIALEDLDDAYTERCEKHQEEPEFDYRDEMD